MLLTSPTYRKIPPPPSHPHSLSASVNTCVYRHRSRNRARMQKASPPSPTFPLGLRRMPCNPSTCPSGARLRSITKLLTAVPFCSSRDAVDMKVFGMSRGEMVRADIGCQASTGERHPLRQGMHASSYWQSKPQRINQVVITYKVRRKELWLSPILTSHHHHHH